MGYGTFSAIRLEVIVRRYVLYDDDYGIFLGSVMDLAFWSRLDSQDQDAAVTFASPEDARSYTRVWNQRVENVQVREVEADLPNGYASIKALAAAGLPVWTP